MLTVMFATRNGAALLAATLPSYEALEPPAGGWRLVVIDNASTDETRAVLATFQDRLPLTVLSETRPGKNAALNRGLAAIEGDLVVLTDDDVFPARSWLVAWRRAADEQSASSLFGGTILPRWEMPPPDWVARAVPKGPVFTLTEAHYHREGPIDPNLIFGPNMAIRAEIFAKGFRFDETIGPNGANYAMGSESEFTARLARAGYATWFCVAAIVEHFIRHRQLDRRWILERATRYGRGRYRLNDRFVTPPPPTWFGVPRYFYRQLLAAGLAHLRATIAGNDEARFAAQWAFNFCFGQMIEARRIAAAGAIEPQSGR